jgi:hypothetical protein
MNETSFTTTGYISGNISTGTSTTTTAYTSPGLTLQGNSTINYSNNLGLSQAVTNSNNMVRQVRVAVFTVKRNKENKIVSAEFTKELWVEIKNGSSVELAVAKELDKDFDPANTVIKEMYSITF